MGIAHWDEVDWRRRAKGELDADWQALGRAAGTTGVGLNRVRVAPGRLPTPPHSHGASEELFYVLAGSGLAWQDEQVHDVRPGDCVVHRADEHEHTFVAGAEGLEYLVFGTRHPTEIGWLPRSRAIRIGWPWVEGRDDDPWELEAAGPPLQHGDPAPRPGNIVNVDEVEPEVWGEKGMTHPLATREQTTLAGLHWERLGPGRSGSVPHCHSEEEEIFVILDGSATLHLWPSPTRLERGAQNEEHQLRPGHVVARPPGSGVAHSFRAGGDGVTMLVYGTRRSNDTTFYPRSNKIFFRGLGVIARVEPLAYGDGETDDVGFPLMLEQFEGAATIEKIAALCRRRAFVFPSSDIYGGLGSSFDFGHYGVLLNDNVKAEWRRSLIQEREDVVALDSAIILNPQVWVASGHVAGFSDPLVDCRTCKLRFRADKLRDSACGRRPSKHPGDFVECDLTEPREFNLMFETHVGPVREDAARAYLRPETAQGIFVNFKNVVSSMRVKPPFGIAQIGKSFRNEITPGNFLFRMREFEQMEMEFFVPPADAADWHAYWIEQRLQWHLDLGLRPSHVRVRPHGAEELSHYSSATSDIEYLYPIGWQELEGVANRGDYDLRQHADASGTKLEWVGQDERYVPHVIEPAISVVRSTLAFLCEAYDEETVVDRPRTVLRLHPRLAPVKVAVLPLIGRDAAMVERARPLYEDLRRSLSAEYDDAAAIGKRYRRQDEIGTPWALTVDAQTLADGTVTLRDRDTLEQERIPIDGAKQLLLDRLDG